MLINFALTGKFGDDNFSEQNDYMLGGKKACSIWVLLKAGKIASIEGLEKIKNHKNVIFVVERFKEGDEVASAMVGTERQVLYRIYTVTDSVAETNQTILDIQNILDVRDESGNDMVLEWTKLWNTDEYSHH
jgi:hypothetical protein